MRINIFAFAFWSLLMISACSKNKDISKDLQPGRCRISCEINGDVSINFNSDDGYSFSAYNAVSMVLEPVVLNTTSGNKEHISLLVPVSITAGTYDLSTGGAPNISFSFTKENLYAGESKTWNATVGSNMTFIITKASYTELEGTFNGTATNTSDGSTITITNAKFSAKFSH